MINQEKNTHPQITPSANDKAFEIALHRVPIEWDLDGGCLTFFGLDSALFWTNPSLVHMFSPLAEEIGIDLFRLLVAHSSSLGTREDFHAMVSTLGDNFLDGFLAWGKAVSTAGWGAFDVPEYDLERRRATVRVRNPWEISMQRSLDPGKRWGCPFLQGKIIGIFNHAFGISCWARETCVYDSINPHVRFEIHASRKTIKGKIKKLRFQRMLARERTLAENVEQKTAELTQAKRELENYSKTLEQKVAERTQDLQAINQRLEKEISVRRQAEQEKENLIVDLQNALKEVKTLGSLLPICSSCKKIRDDKGYWNKIEAYISKHTGTEFSHSICPACARELYPDLKLPRE